MSRFDAIGLPGHGRRRGKWSLIEKQVKARGEPGYMWQAVDGDGEVLDFFFTKTHDEPAALAFFKKALPGMTGPDCSDEQ